MYTFICCIGIICCGVLYCLLFILQYSVPQTLRHKFGTAAVRGVARNKNITEFQLELRECGQHVADDILAQLTADSRMKFRVEKDRNGDLTIELYTAGKWCIVTLLMQCLCCVSPVLSQLYQRSSLSFPSWLCWLGGPALSCVWTVHHL